MIIHIFCTCVHLIIQENVVMHICMHAHLDRSKELLKMVSSIVEKTYKMSKICTNPLCIAEAFDGNKAAISSYLERQKPSRSMIMKSNHIQLESQKARRIKGKMHICNFICMHLDEPG